MPVLLAEPPDDREPSPLPGDPSWTAANDQFTASIAGTTLWTYGGEARFREAARQEPWQ